MQKEVIYRHLIGKSTPEEELAIKEWYYRNPDECQKEIDEVRFLFEGALLHYAIGKPEARTMRKPRGLRLNIRRVMRVAAVIALLVSCMFGMRELAFHGVSGQMTAFEVPAGQRIAIDLSDGTRVWLNSESRIEYPAVFGRRENFGRGDVRRRAGCQSSVYCRDLRFDDRSAGYKIQRRSR